MNTLLDSTGKEIIKNLSQGQNVLIASLPGMGLNTYIKEVTKNHLNSNTITYKINLYSYESYSSNFESLEKLLFEKFRIENGIDSLDIYSLPSLINYLDKCGNRLLIVVHKINDFVNLSLHLSYLSSVYRSAFDRISILVSLKLKDNLNIREKYPYLSIKAYTFRGFTEKYPVLFEKMVQRYQIDESVVKVKDRIFENALGHAGLTKALIAYYGTYKRMDIPEVLLKDHEVLRRLSEVFISLKNMRINLDNLKNEKPDPALEDLGLSFNNKHGKLFAEYYLSRELKEDSFYKDLTSTESDIFRILKDSENVYTNFDQLAYVLGGSNFDKYSDWVLYKHINNINKKIKNSGLFIENKRSKGYKLIKTRV